MNIYIYIYMYEKKGRGVLFDISRLVISFVYMLINFQSSY